MISYLDGKQKKCVGAGVFCVCVHNVSFTCELGMVDDGNN